MSTLSTNNPPESPTQHIYNCSEKSNNIHIPNPLLPITLSQLSSVDTLLEFYSLAVYSILVLSFFIILSRYTQKAKNTNEKESRRIISTLRHRFSTGIPLFDGVYTLHLIKTGMHVIIDVIDKYY